MAGDDKREKKQKEVEIDDLDDAELDQVAGGGGDPRLTGADLEAKGDFARVGSVESGGRIQRTGEKKG